MSRRYLLISPCRDEAKYARRTLRAIDEQTVKPTRWIIVDDGSTDETPAILAEFAKDRPWVTIITREDRGERKVGPGVIEAFYAGYDTIDPSEFDYVCKLDLDLDIPPRYFERLMERMEADERLGSTSGKIYFPPQVLHGGDAPTREQLLQGQAFDVSSLVSEGIGDEVSLGMTKFYRRACFEHIGGFVREVMWDGIDCTRTRMLGWKVNSVEEPETRMVHLRPMGSSHKGILTGRRRHGFGQYFMGTSLTYMTASAVFRFFKTPAVLGSVMMMAGYLGSAFKRAPRYDDLEFRRYLRRYHRLALRKGKSGAARQLEAEAEARWQGLPNDSDRSDTPDAPDNAANPSIEQAA